MLNSLEREGEELARSEFYADLTRKAEIIVTPMAGSSDVYDDSLGEALACIARVATLIPLSASVMRHALALRRAWSIAPQDAIVLASVDLFMREKNGLKLFANKNRKDFTRPDVVTHFRQCDCRVLRSFAAARYLAEASLPS